MKQKNLILFILAILPVVLLSCSDDDDDLIGKWYKKSNLDGKARAHASSFVIGDHGYVLCGFDGKNRMSDCYKYDMRQNYWIKIADFPGTPRQDAAAFAINGKGYLGMGYDGSDSYSDFYEYDPTTNTWQQIEDFPLEARYDAVAFSVGGKGYVGAGYSGNYEKTFASYDPQTGKWEQIKSIGGSKRRGASSFVINDIAYVVGGKDNGELVSDFWAFDYKTGEWTEKRTIISDDDDDDYDDDYDIVREYGVTFVIDGCGYYASGIASALRTNVWKYYPETDLWENVAKFKGTHRQNAVGFSNGEMGFVTTGKSSSYYLDDIWEINPYEYDDDEY